MRSAIAFALLLSFAQASGGCFNQVADHCPGCRTVRLRARSLPPLDRRARLWVVLVPGALGFGDEWRPVLAALAGAPRVDFFVYEWPGPWQHPSDDARELGAVLDAALAGGPKTVLVIGHSAGAMLATCAAGLARVPRDHHLIVAAIAAPGIFQVTPYQPERHLDTPLGFAVGGRWPKPPLPGPRVRITEYLTEDRPSAPPPEVPRLARIWLGAKVGHNRSLGLVAAPLVRALAAELSGVGGSSSAARTVAPPASAPSPAAPARSKAPGGA